MFGVIALAVALWCAHKWAWWRIVSMALFYYMEKNGYTPPTKEEILECTRWVGQHIADDLTKGRTGA